MLSNKENTKKASEIQWNTNVKQLEEETAGILQKYGKTKHRSRSNDSSRAYPFRAQSFGIFTSKRKGNSSSLTKSTSKLFHSNIDNTNINTIEKNAIAAVTKIQRFFRSKSNKKIKELETFHANKEYSRKWVGDEDSTTQSGKDDNYPRLFKEDGSVNLSLRAVVADALKTHRFDNVPAILLHERSNHINSEWRDNEHLNKEKRLQISDPNYPPTLFPSTDRKLVSNLSFTKTSNRSFSRSKRIPEREKDPIAFRNIHYPGVTNPTLNSLNNESSNEDFRERKRNEVCFNCWSACKISQCTLLQKPSSKDENNYVCDLWGIRFLRQSYRCEDIERKSSTDLSALRFVKDNRRRSAVSEHQSHPIYTSLSKYVAKVNFRNRRRLHIRQWFKSFINNLKLNMMEGAHYTVSGENLRAMGTRSNVFLLKCVTNQLRDKLTCAPITETDREEDSIIIRKMVLSEKGMVEKKLIVPEPPPIPLRLYQPKAFKYSPIYKIKLRDSQDEIDRYAFFGQKKIPNSLAIGGLSREVILLQKIHKVFPPEFCHFTVDDQSVSIPELTLETFVPQETFVVEPKKLEYVERELQHILNSRRVPTITIKVGIKSDEKHYFGLNRPEQTGETEYRGFRTSESATLPPLDTKIETSTFIPSCDISSPNTPKQLPPARTKADLNYPFCEIESRKNSIEDLSYILGVIQPCTLNKPQSFTVMTLQEPGKFLRNYNVKLPLGRLGTVITRSWTFLQKRRIAKFVSQNGVPYWFDRRAGQTFWERPLSDEELLPVKEGGILLGSRSNDYLERMIDYNDAFKARSSLRKVVLSQQDESNNTKKISSMVSPIAKENFHQKSEESIQNKSWSKQLLKFSPRGDKLFSNNNHIEFKSGDHLTMKNDEVFIIESDGKDTTSDHENFHLSEKPEIEKGLMHEDKIMDDSNNVNGTEPNSNGNGETSDESDIALDSIVEQNIKEHEIEEEKTSEVNDKIISSSNKLDCDKTRAESSKLISSITHVLGGMLKDISNSEEDILKLGVGLGMSLTAQGVLTIDEGLLAQTKGEEDTESNDTIQTPNKPDLSEPECSSFPIVVDTVLSEEKDDHSSLSQNSQESSQKNGKIEHCFPKSYVTHKVSELGIIPKNNKRESVSNLQSFSEPISSGFLDSIKSRKVGKQHVHYIESSPNLPECKPVGRVKPRSAGKDWLAIGFDPWSTGKELLNIEFVPFLVEKEEESNHNLIPLSAPKDAVCFVKREETKENSLINSQFKQLCSCIRHGNYSEFERMLEDCNGLVPIDYTDDVGNTLLMVSCQNGNKRMVKLCLRKGSDVNKQNTNGHTGLHYAFGYGFDDLGAYLISKGADDSITNADGLTCYEGLRIEDLSSL